MQKLYCYVDETGQDTRGTLFIVTVVVAGPDRETVRRLLQKVEIETGKGRKKWVKATRRQRQAYMERILHTSPLQGYLFYACFSQTTDYFPCVLHTVGQALIAVTAGQQYQATVFIDGLRKGERHKASLGLRRRGVNAKKVRGLRDESDEFIRLADATAGFVRDALEGQPEAQRQYQAALTDKILEEV